MAVVDAPSGQSLLALVVASFASGLKTMPTEAASSATPWGATAWNGCTTGPGLAVSISSSTGVKIRHASRSSSCIHAHGGGGGGGKPPPGKRGIIERGGRVFNTLQNVCGFLTP
eukprot:COSAG01_NODE_25835_length_731_cov_2.642405_1_plen_113_part_01